MNNLPAPDKSLNLFPTFPSSQAQTAWVRAELQALQVSFDPADDGDRLRTLIAAAAKTSIFNKVIDTFTLSGDLESIEEDQLLWLHNLVIEAGCVHRVVIAVSENFGYLTTDLTEVMFAKRVSLNLNPVEIAIRKKIGLPVEQLSSGSRTILTDNLAPVATRFRELQGELKILEREAFKSSQLERLGSRIGNTLERRKVPGPLLSSLEVGTATVSPPKTFSIRTR